MLALISPVFLMTGAALATRLLWHKGRKLLRPLLMGAAVTVAVLAPWALRNRIVLGEWIWTRSTLGVELRVSNHDLASPRLEENVRPGGIHSREHPYANAEQHQRLVTMGEAAYQRLQRDRAIAWILANPGAFARLSASRFVLFWFPQMRTPIQTLLVRVLAFFGLVGLVLAARKKTASLEEVALVLLVYPIPYYIIEVSPRYRYPLDGLIVLLAAVAVANLACGTALSPAAGSACAESLPSSRRV
jgi:hypothetical protein